MVQVNSALAAVPLLHRTSAAGHQLWARQAGGDGRLCHRWRVIIRNLPFKVGKLATLQVSWQLSVLKSRILCRWSLLTCHWKLSDHLSAPIAAFIGLPPFCLVRVLSFKGVAQTSSLCFEYVIARYYHILSRNGKTSSLLLSIACSHSTRVICCVVTVRCRIL